MKKNWMSLGLMSGTSGDGVDASLIKTNGLDEYKFSLINILSMILIFIEIFTA